MQKPEIKNNNLLRNQALINGKWLDADGGVRFDVINPADGSIVGQAPSLSRKQIEAGIDAAQAAFLKWRGTLAEERATALRNWAAQLHANVDDLALLMTLEQGKPLKEARTEVTYAASFLEWFADEARRGYGDVIPQTKNHQRLLMIKQPVGVCAAITPWNFPAAMITRKVAPAIAAGCSVIVKPAEATPLTALALGYLAQESGLPDGVLNIVTGKASEIGKAFMESPLVRKLSFTGSTEVGRKLYAGSAEHIKKISLELGGNAPFIVFDDADLDAAIEGAMASKFRNAGQTCVCANRVMVQAGIYDKFLARIEKRIGALKTGPGWMDDVDIGPLINEAGTSKVEELVGDAGKRGAKLLVGGQRDARGGNFYLPSLLADTDPSMALSCSEIFGPVMAVSRFNSEDEAVQHANDTPYGLASYFYTQDHARMWRVAERLEYGMVGVNEGMMSTAVAPFGGWKESGIGREGSQYGIEEYFEKKYICFGGLDQPYGSR